MTTFSLFSRLNITFINAQGETMASAKNAGFAKLCTLSILNPDQAVCLRLDDEAPKQAPQEGKADGNAWSIWFFEHGRWNWRTIGIDGIENALEDLLFEVSAETFNGVEEIRICPPNVKQPGQVA